MSIYSEIFHVFKCFVSEKLVSTCNNVAEGFLTHAHWHHLQVLKKTKKHFLLPVVREGSVKSTGIICQENSVLLHRCENVPACLFGEGKTRVFSFAAVLLLWSHGALRQLESPWPCKAETEPSLRWCHEGDGCVGENWSSCLRAEALGSKQAFENCTHIQYTSVRIHNVAAKLRSGENIAYNHCIRLYFYRYRIIPGMSI